ncbi:hypothetical protein OG987_13290 [Streptomyces sp. NBC_01620]|uniref:hypothetical protein n=1 Tax=Streptomyces sp. NBC_01620 TaxID=2975902 RepID=UPI00386F4764|nr:hypothetical protein OG987_13290 [Streptomyces sp. NBC_01620]
MSQRYVEKRGANHTLHLILSFLTCGIWAITGWPIAAAMGRKTVTRVPTYQPPVMPQQQYPQQYGQPQQQYPAQQGYPPQQPYQAPPYYGPQQPPPGQYGPPPQ